KGDPVAEVHRIAGGGGVDYAFEVVGHQQTVEQAFNSTHRGGTTVVVGVCPTGTRISIDPTMLLQQRELTSRRVQLGEVNQAYEALLQGEVKRSVVVFE